MSKATCSVAECEGVGTRRGLCTKHYQRWRRHGDPSAFRPDATRGCSIEGCDLEHYARTWCATHYQRWLKTGDPLTVRPHFSPLAGRSGDENPQWRGEDVGYQGVHIRLRKELGSASLYPCSHCGGEAEEWAYDHEDPEERVCERSGLAFSTAGSRHYLPLCVPCHRRFDAPVEGPEGQERTEDLHSSAA